MADGGTWQFCSADLTCTIDWFDHWQTLNAGILALAAAFLALWVSRAQLRAQRDQLVYQRQQEQRERDGRRRAARAALPAALSDIIEYARQSAEWLQFLQFWSDSDSDDTVSITSARPTFPPSVLPVLERNLEALDDGAVTQRIESILREAQVLDARMLGIEQRHMGNRSFVASCIIQCASIRARAETLFNFARRACEGLDTEPLWDRFFATLHLMQITREGAPTVWAMAERERDQGGMPGEADEAQTI